MGDDCASDAVPVGLIDAVSGSVERQQGRARNLIRKSLAVWEKDRRVSPISEGLRAELDAVRRDHPFGHGDSFQWPTGGLFYPRVGIVRECHDCQPIVRAAGRAGARP